MSITSLFQFHSLAAAMPLVFAVVLLVILIVSFRSRAVVFCQYLETMTGIRLKPTEVRKVFDQAGRNGVREMFLDLIIREDLKEGPAEIPEGQPETQPEEQKDEVAVN
ncbi:MAG TPA: hypothetical protein VLV78_10275 [Thermoanaerobaculia bacterium]|nr:hypothetical protein [Thermoanaerobaculia bacterium]